jgi:hypothetical protein
VAKQRVTREMMASKGPRSARSLAGRNRAINQIRKRTKHADMGIYAKRRSPANRPGKA